jgi:hypothetical protein
MNQRRTRSQFSIDSVNGNTESLTMSALTSRLQKQDKRSMMNCRLQRTEELRGPRNERHVVLDSATARAPAVSEQLETRSGVYFNDQEVPNEMHFRCSSRQQVLPMLPKGKPMPRPPKLLLKVPDEVLRGPQNVVPAVRKKRKQLDSLDPSHFQDTTGRNNPIKCLRTNDLPAEQMAFLEAALTLAHVRNACLQNSSPMSLPHSKAIRGALPPPPFSLSMRANIARGCMQRDPATVEECSSLSSAPADRQAE